MKEPTVLDYVKAKLTFWRPSDLHFDEPEQNGESTLAQVSIPEAIPGDSNSSALSAQITPALETKAAAVFPWRLALPLLAALIAQIGLEPPFKNIWVGIWFYLMAASLVVLGSLGGDWQIANLRADERQPTSVKIRWDYLLIGIVLAGVTFLAFANERFTILNSFAWMVTIVLFIRAFWIPKEKQGVAKDGLRIAFPRQWNVTISREWLLVAALVAVVVFFRIYRLDTVPAEMVSDHAEKLLDIQDVLHGSTPVFFPRNTGREAFQFYLTAGLINIFHLPIDFLTLKIGTILCGLLTLPYIYLLGKEIGNQRVGIFAALFAGIAYWPNVISRIALRFTLYPFFAAPCLYYLIRGLRRQNRNDFILSGIFLGLGLHGYTSFRIMPFVVVAAVAVYLLHRQSRGARYQTWVGLGALTALSIIVFLPLGRYAFDNPQMFSFRTFSRLTSLEQPLPGPALAIFFSNLWNAITMFFWSDGNTWVHSVVFRPALDAVSAALFFLGLCLIVIRYIRTRNWTDPFLILSIPLMMLPSILSLAFPNENPSLNRTSGAIIPVFLLVGIGLDGLLSGLKARLSGRFGQAVVGLVFSLLFIWSATQNYSLVFDQYASEYRQNDWNYTEVGQVIRSYATSIGTFDTAWVVAYPYWYDTRLVGIEAGLPAKDFAIWPDQLNTTLDVQGNKLFIVNPQDEKGIATLRQLYPHIVEWMHASMIPGKDFLMFLAPAGS